MLLKRRFCIIILLLISVLGCEAKNQVKTPDVFGIYISTLDGENRKMIISDHYREMNHVRVSPDKKWITFTRFNKRGPKGFAMERDNYFETEIMIARIDGTDQKSLTRPRKKTIAANSYWTPDSKALIYISNENLQKKVQINRIDIATGEVSRVPTPKALSPSDPHQRGKLIVFPVIHADKKKPNTIWIMNEDGTKARQLTKPVLAKSLKGKKLRYRLGDFDPKISPDGSKVALMRQVKKEDWHIIVVNVNSGEEKDLSPGGTVDAMPEWSSDGKLLVFWHVDPKNPLKSGLYTIKADGTERKKIPLPRGYFYSMPSFVPGEGSDKQTRIIYSARIAPKM